MINSVDDAANWLRGGRRLVEQCIYLDLDGFGVMIRSDSSRLLRRLERYFAHVTTDFCEPTVRVEAYDTEALKSGPDWKDWTREAGKTGRKDAYFDLPGGRLVLKVRTGIVFLQSESARIATGPCNEQPNQIVNFINSQYMNWLQQRKWLICHAAAVDVDGVGVAIAGSSGGGKSTAMLRLMDRTDVQFVSNDRLLLREQENCIRVSGIPKMPRVNPGTIVHNPMLCDLIDQDRRRQFLSLPEGQLWDLEEKHDVMIEEIYGAGRIKTSTWLGTLIVLNWSNESVEETRIAAVDCELRSDLLAAVMKPSGPFYQLADGTLYQDTVECDPAVYRDVLQKIAVLEVRGRIDFDRLKLLVFEWITTQSAKIG